MSGSVERTETNVLPPASTNAGAAAARLIDRISVVPLTVAITLSLAAFFNPIQPVSESRVSLGNPLLLARLAVAGLAWAVGIWGLVRIRSVRQLLTSLPGIGLIVLAATFALASCFGPPATALISRAAAMIFFGYVLLITTSIAVLGVRSVLMSLYAGVGLYLIVAWIVFLFFPSVGRFYEYTDAESTVMRMGGVGHPNSVAKEAAVCLLMTLAMLRSLAPRRREAAVKPRWSWGTPLAAMLCLLTLATLAATLSRTAMLAVVAASVMMFFDVLWGRRGVILTSAVVMIGTAGLAVSLLESKGSFSQSATAVITKSGDIEELTSLTGRTRIWGEAMEWIRRRPLVGYGLDSAASVMSKESVGTHNLLLHVLFSAGAIGGCVMVLFLIKTIAVALGSQTPLFRGAATFVLVSGLVEDTLFPSFPASLTLVWLTMMLVATGSQSRRAPA